LAFGKLCDAKLVKNPQIEAPLKEFLGTFSPLSKVFLTFLQKKFAKCLDCKFFYLLLQVKGKK